ncbi:Uncharacterised protein [Mycobacteroides abscessus subsp. abscessus]|nr:Uncharacterised protein [Mycobacteroides abscessus subsp. abscessus]
MQLLIDEQLLRRARAKPIGRRPVRRQETRLGQPNLMLSLWRRGDFCDLPGDLRALALHLAEVDRQ